jgi:2-polyprenyl-6-methoxyphenol hydroxylase-like FAD-dependent oxidoreductase
MLEVMPSDASTQVLIIGAGPTGLTAASELARHGVRVRIVEQHPGASIHSKALIVQARTLEVFYAMGIADAAAAAAQPVFSILAHLDGKPIPMIQFGEVDGPFSKPMMLRQSQTERLLASRLADQGVAIEWNTSLTEFTPGPDFVEATLSTGERVRVDYLLGCDGAHSVVRKQLGVAFEGSTYPNDFLQVDCKVRWDYPNDGGLGFFNDAGVIVCLPLGKGVFRFVLIRRERPENAPDEPTLAEFQAALSAEVPGEVELYDPEWLIRFRLHERLAEQYRIGRVFLVGDAAHIHTPAGGQGMNTGIQDAHNLAWKIGLALRGHGGQRLLDSYHAERHPIAADILRFTDVAFRTGLGGSMLVRKLRPLLLPVVFGSSWVNNKVTRTMGQLEINVRRSPIVEDDRFFPTGPHAGDRAPDATFVHEGASAQVFEVVRGTQHVVFAHCARPEMVAKLRDGLRDGLDALVRVVIADEGDELEERYHLGSGPALWVVRPDGYIGYRQSGDEPESLLRWWNRTINPRD